MTILNTKIRTFLQAKDSLADEGTEFLGIHFMSRRGFPPFWILFLVYIYPVCVRSMRAGFYLIDSFSGFTCQVLFLATRPRSFDQ